MSKVVYVEVDCSTHPVTCPIRKSNEREVAAKGVHTPIYTSQIVKE